MTAPTQPPAAERCAGRGLRAGEPPASAASPATASSIRVAPITARAGSGAVPVAVLVAVAR